MTTLTVRSGYDGYVDSVNPATSYASAKHLKLATGSKYAHLYAKNPAPRGATVTSAILRVYAWGASSGSRTLTARRITQSWKVAKLNYNNRPSVLTSPAATAAISTVANLQPIDFDVTAHVQATVGNVSHYGWRIETTGSLHYIQSFDASLGKPQLIVTYADNPSTPTDLTPNGGLVSVASPVLTFSYGDINGDDLVSVQVQEDPAANGTTPTFDSGEVPSTQPQLDLSQFVELLTNTSFDVDLSGGWAAGGAGAISRVTTPVHSGAGAIAVTASSASNMQIVSSATGTGAWRVLPGMAYTFSGWVRTAVTGRSRGFVIDWYDATGAVISTSVQTTSTDTTSYVQRSYTATAPAGAFYARPYDQIVGPASAEVHYGDDYHFGLTTGAPFVPLADLETTQWRSRVKDSGGLWSSWSAWATMTRDVKGTVTINNPSALAVVQTNYIGNPGVETSTSGYVGIGNSTTTVTQVADTSFGTGSFVGRQTCTTFGGSGMGQGWQSTRVFQPGTYTFGIIVRPSVAMTIRAYYEGTAVTTGNSAPNIAISAGVATLLTGTITVTTAGTLKPGYLVAASSTVVAGDYVEWDCLALYEGNWLGSLWSYFDGATADTTFYQYDWVGTAQLSESTKSSAVQAINLLPNPSFEGGSASGWSQVGGATNTVPTAGTIPALFGSRALQAVCLANSGPFTVASTFGGQSHAYSAYVYPLATTTITLTATQGAPVGGSASIPGSVATVCPANQWTRLNTFSGVTPTVETSTNFIMKSSVATTIYVDGAIAVQGTDVPAYFDGSYAPPGYTSAWAGTVNNSQSYLSTSVVQEPTPPILWAFAGAGSSSESQAAWQLLVTPVTDRGKILYDTKRKSGADTSWTLPQNGSNGSRLLQDGGVYSLILRAWDNKLRQATPGDPVYSEAIRDFIVRLSATVTPPVLATAAGDANLPCVNLTFTRGGAPDSWVILRDGVVIDSGISPSELFVSGTTYAYKDWTAPPNKTCSYKVRAVVNGAQSASSNALTASHDPEGLWIVEPESGLYFALSGTGVDDWRYYESGADYEPLNSPVPFRIRQTAGGIRGTYQGLLYDRSYATVDQMEAALWDIWEGQPINDLRLVADYDNIPVALADLSCTMSPDSMPGYKRRQVYFRFWQTGELPFAGR